jgi:hypothetical protein
MPDSSPASIQLPDRRSVEVVIVKLPDGRTVARSSGELLPIPTAGPVAPGARPPARNGR